MLKLLKRITLGFAAVIVFIFVVGVIGAIIEDDPVEKAGDEVVATETMQEPEEKKAPAKEVKKKEKSDKQLLEEARVQYVEDFTDIMNDFKNDMFDMSQLYGRVSNNPDLFYDDEFLGDLDRNANEVTKNQLALEDLKPPSIAETYHHEVLNATWKITNGVNTAYESIMRDDLESFAEAAYLIQEGNADLEAIAMEVYKYIE